MKLVIFYAMLFPDSLRSEVVIPYTPGQVIEQSVVPYVGISSIYHEGDNCSGGNCLRVTPRIRRRWLSNRDEVKLYTQPKKGFWERRRERKDFENQNRMQYGYAHPTGIRARLHRYRHGQELMTEPLVQTPAPTFFTPNCRIVCDQTAITVNQTEPVPPLITQNTTVPLI